MKTETPFVIADEAQAERATERLAALRRVIAEQETALAAATADLARARARGELGERGAMPDIGRLSLTCSGLRTEADEAAATAAALEGALAAWRGRGLARSALRHAAEAERLAGVARGLEADYAEALVELVRIGHLLREAGDGFTEARRAAGVASEQARWAGVGAGELAEATAAVAALPALEAPRLPVGLKQAYELWADPDAYAARWLGKPVPLPLAPEAAARRAERDAVRDHARRLDVVDQEAAWEALCEAGGGKKARGAAA